MTDTLLTCPNCNEIHRRSSREFLEIESYCPNCICSVADRTTLKAWKSRVYKIRTTNHPNIKGKINESALSAAFESSKTPSEFMEEYAKTIEP